MATAPALKKFGQIVAIGDNIDLLLPRLCALVDSLNMADECGERIKTLAMMKKSMPGELALKTKTGKLEVLIAGAPAPITLRVLQSLQRQEFNVSAAITVKQALGYLETKQFDCLVLLPGV